MPINVNVGLSRKASRDYQSTGVSINVTAELDQSLLAKPDELRRQVADLYSQAHDALLRQANSMGEPARPDDRATRLNGRYSDHNGADRGHFNGNRQPNGRSSSNGGGMTESQRRAIFAIADRVRVDPVQEAQDILGMELRDLSVRQASELIDHLKALHPSGNGNGRNGH